MYKIKFVVCPVVAPSIVQKDYRSYRSHTNTNHEWRSIASEEYALAYMGIRNIIATEEDLIQRYANDGIRVPECVALDPADRDKIISVEVKRICGNQLPLDFEGQERRKVRSRSRLIWPWITTIMNSIAKAHPQIVADLKIHTHHVVFVLPSSLPSRSLRRLCDRICKYTVLKLDDMDLPVRHVVVHIIQGKDFLFDRF
jgi:hypothetical protein